jgi:hypothetical protein
MKKLKLLLVAALFPVFVFAQGGAELVPFAGYMFGGSLNYVQGKLDIPNGLNYGLSVLVPVQSLLDVEVNWTRMNDVKATWNPYFGYDQLYPYDEFNVATNYFQIGAISKFYNSGSVAQPFGSFSLGATWFDISQTSNSTYNYSDVWRFSIMLGLGVKLMFSDRVGIMLRGRLMMPMTFAGVGFYAGTGGAGLTMNSWVAPLQGDFNGGLIIKLGGN